MATDVSFDIQLTVDFRCVATPAVMEAAASRLFRRMSIEHPTADSDNPTNPFLVESPSQHVVVSRQKRLLAIGMAGVVGLGSYGIMVALLFGVMVAIAGETMPAPSYVGAFLKSPPGRTFLFLSNAAIPIAILLGLFCYSRIMKAQRLIQEAVRKREELRRQVASIRQLTRDIPTETETQS